MKAARLFAALLPACSAPRARRGCTPYPAKAVRVIVPFPPGGANDIVSRLVTSAERMVQLSDVPTIGAPFRGLTG